MQKGEELQQQAPVATEAACTDTQAMAAEAQLKAEGAPVIDKLFSRDASAAVPPAKARHCLCRLHLICVL